MKKVLMLAYYFPPFGAGEVIRIAKFAKYLTEFDWLPTILTVKQKYYSPAILTSTSMIDELSKDVKIYRTDCLIPAGKSIGYIENVARGRKIILGGVINKIVYNVVLFLRTHFLIPDDKVTWIYHALKVGRKCLKKGNFDAIYATGPPYSVLLIAVLLKIITGKALVLDIRDNWAVDPIHISRGKLLKKIEIIMERKIIEIADKVILATESSKSNYLNRYPSLRGKFLLIPNGYDPEDIGIVDKTSDNSKFIITHAGILDKIRDPRYLFKAVSEIIAQDKQLANEMRILLLGDVRLEYQNAVVEMGLEHIIKCVGTVPHKECIRQLYQSSVLLVIPSKNIPTAIPGKIYEYMAIGKPILTLAESGQARDFIISNTLGVAVPPDDVNSIKQAIFDFYEKYTRGALKIEPGDKLLKQYNRKELTAQLSDVLNKVNEQRLEDKEYYG